MEQVVAHGQEITTHIQGHAQTMLSKTSSSAALTQSPIPSTMDDGVEFVPKSQTATKRAVHTRKRMQDKSPLAYAEEALEPLRGIQRKRKVLDLNQRMAVVRLLRETPQTQKFISESYGISERNVRKLWNKRAEIQKDFDLAITSGSEYFLKKKNGKKPQVPEVDIRVKQLISLARHAKLPVTRSTLLTMAHRARNELLERSDISDSRKDKLRVLTFGEKWVRNYVRRESLHSIVLHGEAGSVDEARLAAKIVELKLKIEDFSLENIYNMDETGFFFRLMPKRSYISQGENRSTVRGTKQMRTKDRISVYACTSAVGDKVPLAYIGKSKIPRCLGKRNLARYNYQAQSNAWADQTTTRTWFSSVFLPHVRKRTRQPVCLLIDSCTGHGNLIDPTNQVHVFQLPPSSTAKYQPMDQGIIAAWKVKCRTTLLDIRMKQILDGGTENVRIVAARKKPGTRGISDGYEPNVKDAMDLGNVAWDLIESNGIKACWLQANILPVNHEQELHDLVASEKAVYVLDEAMEELESMICSLSITENVECSDPDMRSFLSDLRADPAKTLITLKNWTNIEDDSVVVDAVHSDLLEDCLANGKGPTDSDDDSASDGSENDAISAFIEAERQAPHGRQHIQDASVATRPAQDAPSWPSLFEAGPHMERLEEMIQSSDEAVSILQKLRSLIAREHAARKQSKKKVQMSLLAYVKIKDS